MRWQYAVIYEATTPEARLELANRLKEDPGILSPSRPYSVFTNIGVRGGKADFLIIHTPAELRHTESFKELRLKIEQRLGPQLMKLLKVHTDLSPEP